MEQYAKTLARRLALIKLVSGVSLVFVILIAVYRSSVQSNESDLIRGFQLGLFIGIQIMLLIIGKRARSALKNQSRLKTMYIEETDERRQLISQKSNASTVYVVLVSVGITAVIVGFYSTTIAITLGAVLFFIAIIRALFKYYFLRKY